MKNLNEIPDEKFDLLPSREPRYRCHRNAYDSGISPFPHRRLRKYLLSQVGKKWSNIVHNYVNTKWVPVANRNYHKLAEFVETHTFMDGKKIKFFGSAFYRSNAEHTVGENHQELFYVHPKTGCLAHKPKTARPRYVPTEKTCIIHNDLQQHIKLDGIWYFVETEMRPSNGLRVTKPFIQSEEDRRDNAWGACDPTYHGVLFGPKLKKTQCGKHELKLWGLHNDPKPDGKPCITCGGLHCHNLHPHE